MQGSSLLPLVQRRPDATWRDDMFVQISESCVGRALRTQRFKYAVTADGLTGRERGSDRYVESALYDLDADPHELTNIIGSAAFAEITAELRERLIARMVEAGEPAPEIVAAPVRPSGQRSPVRPGAALLRDGVPQQEASVSAW